MPVLVLAGESELSKDKRASEIKSEFGGEYIRIHPEDSDKLSLISSYTRNLGMFSKRVVLDILDFDSWKSKEKKELISMVKSMPNEVFLIIRSKKPMKGIESEEFPLPKPWERDKWLKIVREKFVSSGLKISDETAEYFLDLVGTDEYRIESEIEKLSLYCSEEVSIDDVNEITYRSTHAAIDDLCFSISERKYDEAHKVLSDVLMVSDPVMVVASIAKHFEDLFRLKLMAKEKEKYSWPDVSKYSKDLKIPLPKAARLLGFKFKGWKNAPFNHLKNYSKEELADILKKIYVLDRSVKSEGNPKAHIHSFIDSLRRDFDVRYSEQDDQG